MSGRECEGSAARVKTSRWVNVQRWCEANFYEQLSFRSFNSAVVEFYLFINVFPLFFPFWSSSSRSGAEQSERHCLGLRQTPPSKAWVARVSTRCYSQRWHRSQSKHRHVWLEAQERKAGGDRARLGVGAVGAWMAYNWSVGQSAYCLNTNVRYSPTRLEWPGWVLNTTLGCLARMM